MKISVTISTDNAAFQDGNVANEITNIWRSLTDDISSAMAMAKPFHPYLRSVIDSNGNTVGQLQIDSAIADEPIVEAEDDDTPEILEGIIEDNGTNWAGTDIDDLVFCEDCGGVYKITDKFGGISTQQGCRNWIGVAVVLTDLDDSDMSDEAWESMPRVKFDV